MAYGKAKGDGAPYCGTVFRLYPNRTQAAQMEAIEFPPVSLTGGNQAASGWLANVSSYSHGLM